MNKYIFYLGHPAHFHLFKFVINDLIQNGNDVKILIKKKDILEQLLIDMRWNYHNILPKGRKDNKISIAMGMIRRDLALLGIIRRWRPDLMVGTSVEIAHIGKVCGIRSLVVNEDDWDVVPLFSRLAYPHASLILAPNCCRTGKWRYKTIAYNSYHELAYLHPNHFSANPDKVITLYQGKPRYFIIRFAKLTAHHDSGISGLHTKLVEKIIELLEPFGTIHITSERQLEPQFEQYRINIPPLDIHHALAFADLYIGDSQTMSAEAAVLGTPALRFNDFVGRISYLEELEHRYQLTFGYHTNQYNEFLQHVLKLVEMNNRKEVWRERRSKMLSEKMDLNAFMFDLLPRLANYPKNQSKNLERAFSSHTFES